MDYLKIYNRFVDYFKSTTPRDRLFNRNPDDEVNKNLRRTYSFLRTKCYFMRSNGYWQTEDGLKRISEPRNSNFRFCGKGQKGIHELILSRRKDLPNMIRKNFSKEFKNKNFEGKELSVYVKEKLKNDKD